MTTEPTGLDLARTTLTRITEDRLAAEVIEKLAATVIEQAAVIKEFEGRIAKLEASLTYALEERHR